MILRPNRGKKLHYKAGEINFARFPIKTHPITSCDDIVQTIDKYTKKYRHEKDIVVVAEKIIAIMQGRLYPIEAINPSWWARQLHRFVYKHPGGIGLRSPYTMELAIREVGLARLLFAATISVMTKPFGWRGVFYQVAGGNINA